MIFLEINFENNRQYCNTTEKYENRTCSSSVLQAGDIDQCVVREVVLLPRKVRKGRT